MPRFPSLEWCRAVEARVIQDPAAAAAVREWGGATVGFVIGRSEGLAQDFCLFVKPHPSDLRLEELRLCDDEDDLELRRSSVRVAVRDASSGVRKRGVTIAWGDGRRTRGHLNARHRYRRRGTYLLHVTAADRAGHRRLGQAQFGRRLGERAGVGHRDQRRQLTELHIHALSV